MPDALTLPDLDTLDHAALKAIILAHRETYTAQHQADAAALTSRASKIAHLKLLVAKLQRMLFGAKSEKVLHHIGLNLAKVQISAKYVISRRGSDGCQMLAGKLLDRVETAPSPARMLMILPEARMGATSSGYPNQCGQEKQDAM